MWLLSTLIMMIGMIVSLASFVPFWFWFMEAVREGYPFGNWLSPLLWVGLAIFLLGTGISAFLYAGMYKSAERQLLGHKIRLDDLFSASDRFLPLVAVQSVVYALVLIGVCLCLLPGIAVAGLMFFTTPAVVLGKRGVQESIKESYQIMVSDFPSLILFGVVTNLIAGAGAQVCYVGLLASIPLGVLITTVAYYDCTGQAPTNRADQTLRTFQD